MLSDADYKEKLKKHEPIFGAGVNRNIKKLREQNANAAHCAEAANTAGTKKLAAKAELKPAGKSELKANGKDDAGSVAANAANPADSSPSDAKTEKAPPSSTLYSPSLAASVEATVEAIRVVAEGILGLRMPGDRPLPSPIEKVNSFLTTQTGDDRHGDKIDQIAKLDAEALRVREALDDDFLTKDPAVKSGLNN